ncbi:MAG: DNA-binding protein WhiA [Actinomycetia bacterium]|nr:DNA-binding protein WhiA [Actinomycetes bacterium]
MSFSDEARSELASIDPKRFCCRLAEFAGLVTTAGAAVDDEGGEPRVRVDVAAAARRGFTLLRSFGVSADVHSYRLPAFAREPRYRLDASGYPCAQQVLEEAGVVDRRLVRHEVPPARGCSSCVLPRGALGGAFPGGGSITPPRAMHVELRVRTRPTADFLATVAGAADVELRVVERPRHVAAYTKSVETAADVLALMGAHQAALALCGSRLSWGQLGRTPTGWPTPTMPTLCAQAAARAISFARYASRTLQGRSTGFQLSLSRSRSCVSRIRLSPCVSSRNGASCRRRRQPCTAACVGLSGLPPADPTAGASTGRRAR